MAARWKFLVLITWLAPLVHAHTAFTTLFVNGVSQGDGTCVRMNTAPGRVNFPIADITSEDITCGQSGIKPVARTCPIQAGDTVSFQFRSGPGSGSTESIVDGHPGPCGVYVKQMALGNPLPDGTFPPNSPAGDGWFKIMYDDVDSQDKWCTQRVNKSADGVITTKIPTDLAPGYYLLRPELLALHAATNKDPQFYTGCAQVYISGGSGQAKPETVAIPGYVKYSDLAMSWNLYNQTGANYPEYGPKLYKAAAGSVVTSTTSKPSTSTTSPTTRDVQSSVPGSLISKAVTPSTSPSCKGRNARRRKRGLVTRGVSDHVDNAGVEIKRRAGSIQDQFACPSNTILESGNLCLAEVPRWKDTDKGMPGCWASHQACWATADTCWKGKSPAVSYQKGQGCDVYAHKCSALTDTCKNFVMQGPVDEGKVLTPKKAVLSGTGVEG